MKTAAIFLTFFFHVTSSKTLLRNGFPKFPTVAGAKCSRGSQWNPVRTGRIIGGEVPPEGAIPWQIELRAQDNSHHCGGVLISERLVLSAAHCFDDNLKAVAGITGATEQALKVEKFIPHPDFSKLGPYSHDLSLILVSKPGFKLTNLVKPACFTETDPSPGTWCEVSGWGADDTNNINSPSSVLRAAAVPVISMDICRNNSIYGGRDQQILDSMLCAGHLQGGIDSCRGDSGGPLMCETNGSFKLTGIVSWGEGCAQKDKPGVYTRVTSFLSWIRKSVNELGLKLDH